MTVAQDTDKQPALCKLTRIRVNDAGWFSCPVDLNLLAGFPRNVHGYTPLLFLLLNVVTKLRIHKWLILILTARFTILNPQKFFGYSISQQFLTNGVEVWQAPVAYKLLLWE